MPFLGFEKYKLIRVTLQQLWFSRCEIQKSLYIFVEMYCNF
jgi:hypothetical protein